MRTVMMVAGANTKIKTARVLWKDLESSRGRRPIPNMQLHNCQEIAGVGVRAHGVDQALTPVLCPPPPFLCDHTQDKVILTHKLHCHDTIQTLDHRWTCHVTGHFPAPLQPVQQYSVSHKQQRGV